MEDIKMKDIEEFIIRVNEGIKQLEVAITGLRRYRSRIGEVGFPMAILKKEKEFMEEELEKFRNGNISDMIKDEFSEFDRLTSLSELTIEE